MCMIPELGTAIVIMLLLSRQNIAYLRAKVSIYTRNIDIPVAHGNV